MKIWKFKLNINGEFFLKVPKGSLFLSVDLDPGGVPSMWLMVEPSAIPTSMIIKAMFTGHDRISKDNISQFLGTIKTSNLMIHYFEMRS